MSQRRGGSLAKESSAGGGAILQNREEVIPFSKSLDQPRSSGLLASTDRDESTEPLQQHQPGDQSTINEVGLGETSSSPVSLDARYHAESQQLKTKLWQECHFARGFTEA